MKIVTLYPVPWMDPKAWFSQPLPLFYALEDCVPGNAPYFGSPADMDVTEPFSGDPRATDLFASLEGGKQALAISMSAGRTRRILWPQVAKVMTEFFRVLEQDGPSDLLAAETAAFRQAQQRRLEEETQAQSAPGAPTLDACLRLVEQGLDEGVSLGHPFDAESVRAQIKAVPRAGHSVSVAA